MKSFDRAKHMLERDKANDTSSIGGLYLLSSCSLGLLMSPFASIGKMISDARWRYLTRKLQDPKTTILPEILYCSLLSPLYLLGGLFYWPFRTAELIGKYNFGLVDYFKECFTYDFSTNTGENGEVIADESEDTVEAALQIPESKQWGLSYRKLELYYDNYHSHDFRKRLDEKQNQKRKLQNINELIQATIIVAQSVNQPGTPFAKTGDDINKLILKHVADKSVFKMEDKHVNRLVEASYHTSKKISAKKSNTNRQPAASQSSARYCGLFNIFSIIRNKIFTRNETANEQTHLLGRRQ